MSNLSVEMNRLNTAAWQHISSSTDDPFMLEGSSGVLKAVLVKVITPKSSHKLQRRFSGCAGGQLVRFPDSTSKIS